MQKLFAFLFLLLTALFSSAQKADPFAAKNAVVLSGNARFTVLAPELIRLEWSSSKAFTDNASQVFINRLRPVPPYTVTNNNGKLTISTAALSLSYTGNDSFNTNNLVIRHNDTPFFEWKPGLTDTHNLKGTMRTLDGRDGGDLKTLEQGIISRSGWALVNDSRTYVFGKDSWITERKDTSGQDLYFFGYGHNYKKALLDFTAIAGKIPMPPRYAFGYWWSRYWIYGEQEMKDLVNTFRELDVPLDVMIIDMDWHETYGFRGNATVDDTQGSIVGWTGYTWNKNIFPEPERFLKWMEDRNIKNALNLHPAAGIPPMEEKYVSFSKAYSFDTTGRRYIPYYGSDKKWASIYFDSILRPFEKAGVDFWWLDWQQYPFDRLKSKLSNTWWLNHMFYMDMKQQGKRPLLFHRWGGLGNHRYQVGFSGDTYTTWKSLAFQPAFTATASNVGYGYWSHDIGGHQINAASPADIKDGELFLRWMQFGVFSPILRTHSTKKAEIDRRFWNFKNEFRDIVSLVKLRYELNPYIYTASRKAYDHGISLCHPMYYDFPQEPNAYKYTGQYYFGDRMIVAPVVTKTDSTSFLATQEVWLPKGEWEEWFTGHQLRGDSVYKRTFSKSEIPVYVRSGSIIPLYPHNIKNLQQLSDTVILQVFRGSGDGELYEDDGTSDAYQQGKFRHTLFSQQLSKIQNDHTIIIHPAKGSFAGMKNARSWIVKIHKTFLPRSVTVNGILYNFSAEARAGNYTYNGDKLETVIHLKPMATGKEITIQVDNDRYSTAHEGMYGYRGFVERMKFAMERLKFEISAVDWGAALPDLLLKMESLPVRISYHPENAQQILVEGYNDKYKLREVIMNIPDVNKDALKRIADYLELPTGKF